MISLFVFFFLWMLLPFILYFVLVLICYSQLRTELSIESVEKRLLGPILRDERKSASAKYERTSNSEVSEGPTALVNAVGGRDKTAVQKIIRLKPEWVCVLF